ncbi:TNF receptor-associated factor 2-like [Ptychodera flava]|uniref:TNF receptor-associated factor 2-like n=1 Tax=Ptychodera flava TaxID=63121 RepID=UPI00396A88E2
MTQCSLRSVDCEYCRRQVVFKDRKDHFSVCPDMEVPCEFCGKKVIRRKLEQHTDIIAGNCPKKMQRCNYHVIGCEKMVELGKESEHNASYIQDHLELIFRKVAYFINIKSSVDENARNVQELQAKVRHQDDIIKNMQRSIHQMERDLKDHPRLAASKIPETGVENFKLVIEKLTKSQKELEVKSHKLEMSVSTYENIVGVLNQEVERSAEMVQTLMNSDRRLRERLDALEKKTKAQDRIIALKDVTLAEQDLRIQSLEMASYDGVLTWKISEFNRKRRDAISGRTLSLYSPYFFSSQFGYKMCARIYLNGDGMGKGNHVSLFFVVMKGEFDAILRWPFRQKVTFMWIDQNNREHMIDAFRPDPNSSSFKRPTGDMNIASGCPLFMPLSMLEDGKHAYIKDDTAFLRIIVDTHDL